MHLNNVHKQPHPIRLTPITPGGTNTDNDIWTNPDATHSELASAFEPTTTYVHAAAQLVSHGWYILAEKGGDDLTLIGEHDEQLLHFKTP